MDSIERLLEAGFRPANANAKRQVQDYVAKRQVQDYVGGKPPYTPRSRSLTRREEQVMELVREGMTNPEIGDKLCISRFTVKSHIRKICLKLDARNKVHAAILTERMKNA